MSSVQVRSPAFNVCVKGPANRAFCLRKKRSNQLGSCYPSRGMNLNSFLAHYQISENPFRAEEARMDSVFSRVEIACHHPDFDKICGDFNRPASSVVFGERGSGKTAIRLQIEQRVGEHNQAQPDLRCLPLPYDELNPVLDRFHRRSGKSSPDQMLAAFRLVDHIDAMMHTITPRLVDAALGQQREAGDADWLSSQQPVAKTLRQLDRSAKRDLVILQLCYDRPESASLRTKNLKRAVRFGSSNGFGFARTMSIAAAIVCIAAAIWFLIEAPTENQWLWKTLMGVMAGASFFMLVRMMIVWGRGQQLAKEIHRQLRVIDRSTPSFRQSLLAVGHDDEIVAALPRTNDDDLRYAMFRRLLNVLRPFGYRSIMVLVDRVDEPTLINGEPARMRSLVWPMLNNKFLQQDSVAVKMLLPLDLRHLLNRESPEFFREARLDKQNLVEKLVWSGAVLYDLCSARLNACRPADASPISLRELFDDSVTTQDLIDALDQMQQPRDAFKLIYQVIQEHCANVPEESPQWKIARPVLDAIRKQQVERLGGMLRGVRPA